MTGDERNAELSRASILVAAGAAMAAIPQQVPDLADQPLVLQGAMILGVLMAVGGLVLVLRTLMGRRGNDQ